jgi:RHS repeat-associated protein
MIDAADNNAVYYYHFDGLGSVIALSNANKQIIERYSYDVFGEPNRASDVNNPYLFTGRRYDPEAGLYYYRARYYAYDIGRFLQPDPIGYDDGLNLYAYVGGNPLNFCDPSGLCRDGVLKDMWDWWYGGLYNFGYQWGVDVENELRAQAAFRQDWNESMERYYAARYLEIYGQPSLPSLAERSRAFMYEVGHGVEGTACMIGYVFTATVNTLLEPVSQLSLVENMPDIHIPAGAAMPYWFNPEIYISGDALEFVGHVADWVNTEYAVPLAEHERGAYEAWQWHRAQEWQYGNMQYIGPTF